MTLDALIFDVDGTLAETEEAHRAAFNETFEAHGLDWFWSEDLYRALLLTTGGKERMSRYAKSLGQVLPEQGAQSVSALHGDKTRRYNQLVRSGVVELRPGVATLLTEARKAGVRLAVATTTSPENIDALLSVTLGKKASDVFDVIAAGDMVRAKKPAPDVYQLALEGLGVPPAAAVAFEDSGVGLASARAAGLDVIITPSRYTSEDNFSGALAVIPDLSAGPTGDRPLGLDALAGLLESRHAQEVAGDGHGEPAT